MKNHKPVLMTMAAMVIGLTGGVALGTTRDNAAADPACVLQCRRNCIAQYGSGTPEAMECTQLCYELCQ